MGLTSIRRVLTATVTTAALATGVPAVSNAATPLDRVIFTCRNIEPTVPSHVIATDCGPRYRGLVREEFTIRSTVPGAPEYLCGFGWADTPSYVEGRDCARRP